MTTSTTITTNTNRKTVGKSPTMSMLATYGAHFNGLAEKSQNNWNTFRKKSTFQGSPLRIIKKKIYIEIVH